MIYEIIPTQLGIYPKTTRVLCQVTGWWDPNCRHLEVVRLADCAEWKGCKGWVRTKGFPITNSPCFTLPFTMFHLFYHFDSRILSLFLASTLIFTYTIHQNQIATLQVKHFQPANGLKKNPRCNNWLNWIYATTSINPVFGGYDLFIQPHPPFLLGTYKQFPNPNTPVVAGGGWLLLKTSWIPPKNLAHPRTVNRSRPHIPTYFCRI